MGEPWNEARYFHEVWLFNLIPGLSWSHSQALLVSFLGSLGLTLTLGMRLVVTRQTTESPGGHKLSKNVAPGDQLSLQLL